MGAKTIDDAIDFILANAPVEGVVCEKSCFPRSGFQYTLVDVAIDELHRRGEFLDLEAYDVRGTFNMWHTTEGITNNELARRGTRTLLTKLQQDNLDKTFEQILPNITKQDFSKTPINKYGTTLKGMLTSVYDASPYEALKDLIDHDEELEEFKDFQPYDMRMAPQKSWKGPKGRKLARQATKTLLQKIQAENPDKKLEQIIPNITKQTFYTTPINRYGTTLHGMLVSVYDDSPYNALKDLIDNSKDLINYRDLQPYDMHMSPLNTWKGEQGKQLARKATKILLKKIQQRNPDKKLEQIIPTLSIQTFYTTPINRYGTTLTGMLTNVYGNSAYQALKDLAEHDPEIKPYNPVIENLRHKAA